MSSSAAVVANALSALVVGDRVVVVGLPELTPTKPWTITTVDLDSGDVTTSEHALEAQRIDGRVVTSRGSVSYAMWRGAAKEATFFDPTSDAWSTVAWPARPGTFSIGSRGNESSLPVAVAGMVAVRGHLYDLSTKRWARTPALPTGPDSPLVVGGSRSVLSCFGYDMRANRYAKHCYVLEPPAADRAKP